MKRFLTVFSIICIFFIEGTSAVQAKKRLLYIGIGYEDHTKKQLPINYVVNWNQKVLMHSLNVSNTRVANINLYKELKGKEYIISGTFSPNVSSDLQVCTDIFNISTGSFKQGSWLEGILRRNMIPVHNPTSGGNAFYVMKNLLHYHKFVQHCKTFTGESRGDSELAVIYIIGHGIFDKKRKEWYIPQRSEGSNLYFSDVLNFARKIKNKQTLVLVVLESCNSLQKAHGFTGNGNISKKYSEQNIIFISTNNLNSRESHLYNYNNHKNYIRERFKEQGSKITIFDLFFDENTLKPEHTEILKSFSINTKKFIDNEKNYTPDLVEQVIIFQKYKDIDLLPQSIFYSDLKKYLEDAGKIFKLPPKLTTLEDYVNNLDYNRESVWYKRDGNFSKDITFLTNVNDFCITYYDSFTYSSLIFFIKYLRLFVIGLLLLPFSVTSFIFRKRIISAVKDNRFLLPYRLKKINKESASLYYREYYVDEELVKYDRYKEAMEIIFPRSVVPALMDNKNIDEVFLFHNGKQRLLILLLECVHFLTSKTVIENVKQDGGSDYIENLIDALTIIRDSDKVRKNHYVFLALRGLYYEMYRNDILSNKSLYKKFEKSITNILEKTDGAQNGTSGTAAYTSISELIQDSMYLANDELEKLDISKIEKYPERLSGTPVIHHVDDMSNILEEISLSSRYYDKINEPYKAFIYGLTAYRFGKAYGSPFNSDYLRRLVKITANVTALISEETRKKNKKKLVKFLKMMRRDLIKERKGLPVESRYDEFFVNSLAILRKSIFYATGNPGDYNKMKFIDEYHIIDIYKSKLINEQLMKKIYLEKEEQSAALNSVYDLKNQNSSNHSTVFAKIILLSNIFNKNEKKNFEDSLRDITETNIFSHAHIINLKEGKDEYAIEPSRLLSLLDDGIKNIYIKCIDESNKIVEEFETIEKKIGQQIITWMKNIN